MYDGVDPKGAKADAAAAEGTYWSSLPGVIGGQLIPEQHDRSITPSIPNLLREFIMQKHGEHIGKHVHQDYIPPLIVGFQGPQGCGKTYLTSRLVKTLADKGLKTVIFSTDDLYLDYKGLKRLAEDFPDNKMLQGRGPPGTHDVELGKKILESLVRSCGRPKCDGQGVAIPSFDKSKFSGFGDRAPESDWQRVSSPVDVVIFEGWSQGFLPLSEADLRSRYEHAQSGIFLNHELSALRQINESLVQYAESWYPYFNAFIKVSSSIFRFASLTRIHQLILALSLRSLRRTYLKYTHGD